MEDPSGPGVQSIRKGGEGLERNWAGKADQFQRTLSIVLCKLNFLRMGVQAKKKIIIKTKSHSIKILGLK